MSNMKEYHIYKKVASGPKGIHCPCCNSYLFHRSMKATKQKINRAIRRSKTWMND